MKPRDKKADPAGGLNRGTHAALEQRLIELLRTEITNALSVDQFAGMLEGGTAGLASLAHAKAVCEGRLLEKAIAVIAADNPKLKVLTQVRLPIRAVALELVEQNDPSLYSQLVIGANERTLKSYTADLILIDLEAQLAHIVDVKRSLGSFTNSAITELRHRMLAAALVAADLLWKDYRRLSVREVRIVILEAAGKRVDLEGGIWSFSQLDHLVGIAGAADLITRLRARFAAEVEDNLSAALDRVTLARTPAHHGQKPQSDRRRTAGDVDAGATLSDQDTVVGDTASGLSRRGKALIGIAPPPPLH